MKKILLSILILMATFPLFAKDGDNFEYQGINYTVISENDKTCRTKSGNLSVPGNNVSGELIIPELVTNPANGMKYRVIEIGNYSFLTNTNLKGSLYIPASVQTIGDYAFTWCSGFTGQLTIPVSVTFIGEAAFFDCSDFTGQLRIPDSVKVIGANAFGMCSGFTGSLTIPNSVQTIGENAFGDCTGFTGSLTIGNSVQTIGSSAFSGCSGFTGSLIIPNSVQTIGYDAFYGCTGFTGSLTIGQSVQTIGFNAFYNCKGFTGSLTIPNSVQTIGRFAFWNCTGFTGSLTIGNSVQTIGENAFSSCSGFNGALIIGDNVQTIGDSAFRGCSGFTGSLTIPNSVQTIGDFAFGDCTGFTGSLTIGNSVQTIGKAAFESCKGFTGSLTIPNSVQTIGGNAFFNCSGFTGDLKIPDSVQTIGSSAFIECSGFTGSLTIGNSVQTIGNWAFDSCSGFTKIISLAITPPSAEAQTFYGWNNSTVTLSVVAESLKAYKTTSPWSNFSNIYSEYGKDNIIYIINGDNEVTCQGPSSNSQSFNNLEIPGKLSINGTQYSVSSIASGAFKDCSGLKGILTLPATIKTIGENSFANRTGLSEIVSLATTPPSAASTAFQGLNYSSVILTVPSESLQSYKNTSPWSNFTKVHSTYESGGIVYLTGDNNVATCVGATSNSLNFNNLEIQGTITVGNSKYSVTSIASEAFKGCSGLKGTLTIPASITQIGDGAFVGCPGITTVACNATNAPACTGLIFDDSVYQNALLSVKNQENYIKATGWSEFVNVNGYLVNVDGIKYKIDPSISATSCIGLTTAGANLNNPTIQANVSYNGNQYPVSIIEASAFENCTGLKGTLTIPASIKTIGEKAFAGCIGISEIASLATTPPSATSTAFQGWNYSTVILTVPSESLQAYKNTSPWSNFSNISARHEIANVIYFLNKSNQAICQGPVSNSQTFNNLEIQGNLSVNGTQYPVTSIASEAFKGCSGLKGTLTIPASITQIGDGAFVGCPGITTVVCNATNAPACTGLIFDDSVYQNALLSVKNEANYIKATGWSNFVNVNGYLVNVDGIKYKIDPSTSATSCIGLTTAGANLNNPTIQSNVSYNGKQYPVSIIGASAFENCTGLKGNLTLPASIKTIGEKAFAGCTGISEIVTLATTPPSATSTAFQGWNYSTITLSVPSESLQAYKNTSPWSNFTKVQTSYESGGIVYLTSENNGATCVGASSNSLNFNNLEIPGTITVNNNKYSVTSIASGAFRGCSGLKGTVTIPATITQIGEGAFVGCPGITTVVCNGTTPPVCNGSIFDSSVYSNAILKVPSNTIRLYIAAAEWNKFVNVNGTTVNIDGVTYILNSDNSQAECFGVISGEKVEGDLVIPSVINNGGRNYNVTSISSNAFENCTGLRSVVIPAGVVSVGSNAFAGCSGLVKNAYPQSISNPFGQGLNIAYSPSGSTIENGNVYASNKTSLLFVALNSGPDYTVPASVKTIVSNAFYGCEEISRLTIEDSSEALNLDENSLGSISPEYLYQGRNLTGASMAGIMKELTTLVLGNGITEIGSSLYSNCTKLTSLTIPAGVASIASNAFGGCSSLKNLTYNAINCTSFGTGVFPASIEKLTIGNQVTQIPAGFLASGNKLMTLSIPNSVKSIGTDAFINSLDLKSLYIGTGLETININSFYQRLNGTQVASYTIPKIFWMSNTVPSGCENLLAIVNYVSNSLYPFEESKIKLYQYLSSKFEVDGIVYIPLRPSDRTCDAVDCSYDSSNVQTTIPTQVSNNGVVLTVKDISDYAMFDNEFLQTLSIANDGNIGNSAFRECDNLDNLTIANNGVIGESAFRDCTSLKSLKVPDSITGIGSAAFRGCSILSKVELGNGFPVLPDYVFAECGILPELSVPENVEEIGDYAFLGCNTLSRFILEDSDDEVPTVIGSNGSQPLFNDCPLDFVYIGCNIEYKAEADYGYSPFYRNRTLREVVITDLETRIYNYEFYLCSGLKSLTIGNGVTNIGYWAFSGCSSLEFYSAGYKVETIDEEAFSDCVGITEYYSYSKEPPMCGNQALDDINKWTCTLYVPKSALEAYRTADQWKEFFKIEGLDIPAEDIVLNNYNVYIKTGGNYQLTATWVPENATVTNVTWESSNSSVVRVDNNGYLTAVGKGTAVITVKSVEYPQASATCLVTVYNENEPFYAFKMSNETLEIPADGEYQLMLVPAFADAMVPDNVEWTSSDEWVATVYNGKITPVSQGTAVITAIGLDAKGNPIVNPDGSEVKATCQLTVTASMGVDNIDADSETKYNVFTITGQIVKLNAPENELKFLAPGIYIINGRKVRIR